MRYLLFLAVIQLALVAGIRGAEPRVHWERIGVEGGSELLTLFAVLPGDERASKSEEIPLLSVLRDTLGDDNPDNDRLRYVWLLADQGRGRLARWFTPEPDPDDVPRAVVDLSAPAKGIWKSLLRRALQSMMMDSGGAAFRVPSRSYLSSEAASKTVRLFETVTVMARLEDEANPGPLTSREYSQVLTRVLLADRVLGGLVRDASLERVLTRELSARRQALGRNWELLRQRAEAEGLIFNRLQRKERLRSPRWFGFHGRISTGGIEIVSDRDFSALQTLGMTIHFGNGTGMWKPGILMLRAAV